jgi:hypothetical protein
MNYISLQGLTPAGHGGRKGVQRIKLRKEKKKMKKKIEKEDWWELNKTFKAQHVARIREIVSIKCLFYFYFWIRLANSVFSTFQ